MGHGAATRLPKLADSGWAAGSGWWPLDVRQLGRASSGTAVGLGRDDLFEQLAQLGDALGAVALGPALLDLVEEAEADCPGPLRPWR